jgi:hypothetical protein
METGKTYWRIGQVGGREKEKEQIRGKREVVMMERGND